MIERSHCGDERRFVSVACAADVDTPDRIDERLVDRAGTSANGDRIR